MMVSTAPINVWSTSSEMGSQPQHSENTPRIKRASMAREMTQPTENARLRNWIRI